MSRLPRRLPVCATSLPPGKRVSRDVRGLVAGVPVARTGAGVLLGAAGALGLEPGCPLKGRMRALSGRCLPPGVWSLGCRDGFSFVCALVELRHFCCSRRGSCPPSYPILGDREGCVRDRILPPSDGPVPPAGFLRRKSLPLPLPRVGF